MTIADMMDALGETIQEQLCGTANPVVVENLQVVARWNPNPTPPSIDIYPSTPFTEVIAYGSTRMYWFNVRARVTTADIIGGQDLLLAMMDDGEPESIEEAIRSTRTYAGAKLGDIDGPNEFTSYTDTGQPGDLLGTTWRVALVP